MAKEDKVLEPQIKSMLTKTVSLFADVQQYSMESGFEEMEYNPGRLHIHSSDIPTDIGTEAQNDYINNLSGDKIKTLISNGVDVSQDRLRTELGNLWYNNQDGTIDLMSNVYKNGDYSVSFEHNGTNLTFSTPFIKYTDQLAQKEELSLDYLQMEKISEINSAPQETFKVHMGMLKSDTSFSEREVYKANRFYNFAKSLADLGKIEKVDLLTEIQVIPSPQNTNNLTIPVASIKNSNVYNDELPRKEISDKIKDFNQFVVENSSEPISSDSLLPNYNCHSLYQYVNNFNSSDDDVKTNIERYKNYLKQFLTFRSQDIVTSLDQGNITLYLEQYLNALNENLSIDKEINRHLVKSMNVVLMQSMLNHMDSGLIDNYYFPVGSVFNMIAPVTDDKIYDGDTPDKVSRRKSLIETLDRWDLDYAVLKAIVENVGFNPEKNNNKFVEGYRSNQFTHRPLFSETDKVMTFPPIGYSEDDSGLDFGSLYTNINSFPLYNLNHSVDNPESQDISLFFLYLYAGLDPENLQSSFPATFSFYGDNIYDQNVLGEPTSGFTNHIYLDLPGQEDSTVGKEFVKRDVAEDYSISMQSLIKSLGSSNDKENNIFELVNFKTNGGKTRDFSDIVKGHKAPSEIVYWRIEKKDTKGNLVKNIFIPNAPEFNPKVFVDSQLLEEKEYEYTIYAWHVVYGTKYSYQLADSRLSSALRGYNPPVSSYNNFLDFQDENKGGGYFNYESIPMDLGLASNRLILDAYSFDINVNTEPYLQMLEIPYFSVGGLSRAQAETRTLTSIPSPPSVEVVPYENTNNALLFLLNASAGTIEKDFMIGINPEDDDKLYAIYQKLINNNVDSMINDMKVEFNTTSVDRFEIYRLEEKPRSYKDFTRGKLIGPDGIPGIKPVEIYGKDEEENEIKSCASTLSFKDVTIVPNKKYYYTFRVIDKDGNFSNPTSVYEIEIIDDNGTIYPIIDTIDFDYENNLQSMKSVRKYLHIIPSLEQSLIDLDTNKPDYDNQTAGSYIAINGNKNPKLGLPDLGYKIFKDKDNETDDGKKEYFKVRMTSKKTGKKVDINVKFKVKHNETKEQKNSLEQ